MRKQIIGLLAGVTLLAMGAAVGRSGCGCITACAVSTAIGFANADGITKQYTGAVDH